MTELLNRPLTDDERRATIAGRIETAFDPVRSRAPVSQLAQWVLNGYPWTPEGAVEVKTDGETWKAYAERLEHRIKIQRDQIKGLQDLRVPGDKKARAKIERLTSALGRMTLRWEREVACREGILERLKQYEPDGSLGLPADDGMTPIGVA